MSLIIIKYVGVLYCDWSIPPASASLFAVRSGQVSLHIWTCHQLPLYGHFTSNFRSLRPTGTGVWGDKFAQSETRCAPHGRVRRLGVHTLRTVLGASPPMQPQLTRELSCLWALPFRLAIATASGDEETSQQFCQRLLQRSFPFGWGGYRHKHQLLKESVIARSIALCRGAEHK